MSGSGIKCRRCGNVNPLGRMFCVKCGDRLDLSRVSMRVLAKGMRDPRESLVRFVRFLLLLLLLVVISLLLWPSSLTVETGAENDAQSARGKISTIEQAQRTRLDASVIVTEREANAYLADLLGRDPDIARSEGLKLGLETIMMRFQRDAVTVVVLANWGPLRLSYEVTGKPVIDRRDGFRLDVTAARWGHLPLPGPAGDWVGARVARVFSQMENERRVLDRLERCDVASDKVRLVTKGRR